MLSYLFDDFLLSIQVYYPRLRNWIGSSSNNLNFMDINERYSTVQYKHTKHFDQKALYKSQAQLSVSAVMLKKMVVGNTLGQERVGLTARPDQLL